MDRVQFNAFADSCVPGLLPGHGFEESLSDQSPHLAERLEPLVESERVYSGKVRERIELESQTFLFTSDRVSAFDVILGLVPCKGEVLNRLSEFWFNQTKDIVPNHLIRRVGGRGLLCRSAQVLPIEVVVRGYLTGSAWRDYQAEKPVSGHVLPAGLRKDQAFPKPLITPSTKEALGAHDEPISAAEILKRGLTTPEIWAEVEAVAIALFQRGQAIAAQRGLILVDTKYEFGLVDGRLTLVDEVHTPDSSRFWYADTYQSLFEAGQEQKKLDKEYLRTWLLDRGWSGRGTPPPIPADVFMELGLRYVEAYEIITGEQFVPVARNAEAEAEAVLSIL